MREIKFRVWAGDYMAYGGSFSIALDGKLQCERFDSTFDFPDYPVMQYTGLKDKNGKEIYEGDVLRDDQGYLLEVKFGELPLDKAGDCVCTFPAFYAKDHGELGSAPIYECAEIGGWMEIIGNIYDNPELLND